jgi:hypothetical protein
MRYLLSRLLQEINDESVPKNCTILFAGFAEILHKFTFLLTTFVAQGFFSPLGASRTMDVLDCCIAISPFRHFAYVVVHKGV